MIGLEMEDGMYCGQVGEQFNPNQIMCYDIYIYMNFRPAQIFLFITKSSFLKIIFLRSGW